MLEINVLIIYVKLNNYIILIKLHQLTHLKIYGKH